MKIFVASEKIFQRRAGFARRPIEKRAEFGKLFVASKLDSKFTSEAFDRRRKSIVMARISACRESTIPSFIGRPSAQRHLTHQMEAISIQPCIQFTARIGKQPFSSWCSR